MTESFDVGTDKLVVDVLVEVLAGIGFSIISSTRTARLPPIDYFEEVRS